MVLRVRPTPTRFSIKILYTQLDNTLTFYTRCVIPVMHVGCAIREREKSGYFLTWGFPSQSLIVVVHSIVFDYRKATDDYLA